MRKLIVWLLLCTILLVGCGGNTTSSTSVNNTNNNVKKEADDNQKKTENIDKEDTYNTSENIEETTNEALVSDFKPGEENRWKILGNQSYLNNIKSFSYQSDWEYYIDDSKCLMKRHIDGGEPTLILDGVDKTEFVVLGDYIYIQPVFTDSTKGTVNYITKIRTDGQITGSIDTPNRAYRISSNIFNSIIVDDKYYYFERIDESASSYQIKLCCVDVTNNKTVFESEECWNNENTLSFIGADFNGDVYFLVKDNEQSTEGEVIRISNDDISVGSSNPLTSVIHADHLNSAGRIRDTKYYYTWNELDENSFTVAIHLSTLDLQSGEEEKDNIIKADNPDFLLFEFDNYSNLNKMVINFCDYDMKEDKYVNTFYDVDTNEMVNGEGITGTSILKEEWDDYMLIEYVYNNRVYYSGKKGKKWCFYRVNLDGTDWIELE